MARNWKKVPRRFRNVKSLPSLGLYSVTYTTQLCKISVFVRYCGQPQIFLYARTSACTFLRVFTTANTKGFISIL